MLQAFMIQCFDLNPFSSNHTLLSLFRQKYEPCTFFGPSPSLEVVLVISARARLIVPEDLICAFSPDFRKHLYGL